MIAVLVLNFMPGLTLAHGENVETSRYQIMRRMMGTSTLELMEQVEEQMMGKEGHERMESLMDKLIAGNLSAEEQKEIIDFMRDVNVGPGAGSMMMRMMMPVMVQNLGLISGAAGGEIPVLGFGAMMAGFPGMMGYGLGIFPWVFWITTLLVWTALVLLIAVLIRWLSGKRK